MQFKWVRIRLNCLQKYVRRQSFWVGLDVWIKLILDVSAVTMRFESGEDRLMRIGRDNAVGQVQRFSQIPLA